ncbi:MAG: tRNA threonylcarbamoyladenosine dehydratase [Oscillospiraceae bacterium]|nr:tRNA threonylcarbamoyladenosine dehydratase [Oscillospiraceae bacterium]
MKEEFCRTALLLGEEGILRLSQASVAVFGVGGVGSSCVEALARAGVGSLILFDSDQVAVSNINRQLIALHSTVGMLKTEAAARRIADINPDCRVIQHPVFFLPENAGQYDLSNCSYIVDAVDTVAAKISIIELAMQYQIPVISCMGAGNKLDPSRFEVADISRTSVCPLARVMRRELKKRGIEHCKVVYSQEPPLTPALSGEPLPDGCARRAIPGSVPFVPSVAGFILAGEVIKDLAAPF